MGFLTTSNLERFALYAVTLRGDIIPPQAYTPASNTWFELIDTRGKTATVIIQNQNTTPLRIIFGPNTGMTSASPWHLGVPAVSVVNDSTSAPIVLTAFKGKLSVLSPGANGNFTAVICLYDE